MTAHLLAGNFNAKEIQEQYAFISNEIGAYESLDFDSLFERTATFLLETSEEALESFASAVISSTPALVVRAQEILGDDTTLEYLLTANINRLESVWGRMTSHAE